MHLFKTAIVQRFFCFLANRISSAFAVHTVTASALMALQCACCLPRWRKIDLQKEKEKHPTLRLDFKSCYMIYVNVNQTNPPHTLSSVFCDALVMVVGAR